MNDVMRVRSVTFYLFLLAISMFLSYALFSQTNTVDSLRKLVLTDKNDTDRIDHLHRLAWATLHDNPDTTLLLANQALALSEKMQWKQSVANSYGFLGTYYYNVGNYPKALDLFLKALKIDEALNYKSGMAARLGNIGLIYEEQGEYAKSLDRYLRTLKIAEELKEPTRIAIQLGNIGNVYLRTNEFPKALEYYVKAQKMYEQLDAKGDMALNLGNIGIIYEEMGDNEKAIRYYREALKLAGELGDKDKIALQLGNIGEFQLKTGDYKKAEESFLKAGALFKEIGALNEERTLEESLSDLYSKTKRFELSLVHFRRAMVLKDSLFNEEKHKEITQKEMTYAFEKKESAARAEQDKKDAVAMAEKKRQVYILLLVSFVLVLVAVVAFVIFRSLKITRKQKVVIELQKNLVEEKQKEILDSIYYARRIQRSLLPTEKYISKKLSGLRKNDA